MTRTHPGSAVSIVTSALLFPCCLPAAAAGKSISDKKNPQAIKATQAIYDSIRTSYTKQDANAILSHYADDYTEVGLKGTEKFIGKDGERERLQRIFSRLNTTVDDKVIVTGAQMIGPDIVVTTKEDYVRTQNDADRVVQGKYIIHGVYRDFWVKAGDTWLLKRSRGVSVQITKIVDGQRVP